MLTQRGSPVSAAPHSAGGRAVRGAVRAQALATKLSHTNLAAASRVQLGDSDLLVSGSLSPGTCRCYARKLPYGGSSMAGSGVVQAVEWAKH
jgi:hypothetical protein